MDQDLLRNIPLFAKLDEQDRATLAGMLQSRQLAPNEPIFWIGERGDDMFIVQHGQVRLSYTDESGHDVTLANVGPGAFFGELSLLDGGHRTATARTVTDTTLLTLDRSVFYQFIERHPAAAILVISTLATRQRENLEKLRQVKNVNEEMEQATTPLQRLVDRAAAIGASGKFLMAVVVFIGLWVLVQTIQTARLKPDLIAVSGFPLDSPPYFFWLGFMISLVSFLLTVFVLNSQKRQAERDRIRSDMEYQVNLKAQLEVMQLHQKIDRLEAAIRGGPAEPPAGE